MIAISLGRGRVFAPGWLMTALTLVAVAAFVSLGQWQWDRGAAKSVMWENFQRETEAPSATGLQDLEDMPLYSRVTLAGRYLPARQFLLDNRTQQGKPGYEVLTPFALADGGTMLVDRGFLPFGGFRERLPDVGFDAGATLRVTGRVAMLPSPGLPAGRAAPAATGPWPRLTSFPSMDELEAALGVPLAARILLLDAAEPSGYAREWRPPGMDPRRHYSYAVQWWIFAVIAAGLYFLMNIRKVK